MTVHARRLSFRLNAPPRICVVDELDGSIRRDLVALSPADARRVAAELLALADEAEIEATGGVPPTFFPGESR